MPTAFPKHWGPQGTDATVQSTIPRWTTCTSHGPGRATSIATRSVIMEIKAAHELEDHNLVSNAKSFAEEICALHLENWAGKTACQARSTFSGDASLTRWMCGDDTKLDVSLPDVPFEVTGDWTCQIADKTAWMYEYSSKGQVEYKATARMVTPENGKEAPVAEVTVIYKKGHK